MPLGSAGLRRLFNRTWGTVMRKHLSWVGLIAAVMFGVPASAAERSWDFSFQGFFNPIAQQFEPDKSVSGNFVGEDRNHDQVITADELSSFTLEGQLYFDRSAGGGCYNGGDFISCSLSSFSYTMTGELDFNADYHESFERTVFITREYAAGSHVFYFVTLPHTTLEEVYFWTDQTTLTISPVPEPATALLLPAGLAVVYAARRRRGSASR